MNFFEDDPDILKKVAFRIDTTMTILETFNHYPLTNPVNPTAAARPVHCGVPAPALSSNGDPTWHGPDFTCNFPQTVLRPIETDQSKIYPKTFLCFDSRDETDPTRNWLKCTESPCNCSICMAVPE